MKPWNPSDCAGASPLEPSEQREIARELGKAGAAGRRRAPRAAFGSLVGLGLSMLFVAGLAWALAPNSPVAEELLR